MPAKGKRGAGAEKNRTGMTVLQKSRLTLLGKGSSSEEGREDLAVRRSPTPVPALSSSSMAQGLPEHPTMAPSSATSAALLGWGDDSLCIDDTLDGTHLPPLSTIPDGFPTVDDDAKRRSSLLSPSLLASQVAPSVAATQDDGALPGHPLPSSSSRAVPSTAVYGLQGPPSLPPRQRPRFHTVQALDSALHQAIEGKINVKNAWESKEANDLLEGIVQTVEQTLEAHPQDDYGGFAKVATVVEGCSKVWTSRVDSTFKKSNQMVQRLLRNDDDVGENGEGGGKKRGRGGGGLPGEEDDDAGADGNDAEEEEGNGEDDEDDDPLAAARRRRKKSRRAMTPVVSRTLVLDPSEINLDHKAKTALLQSGINAQFRAMTEKFDQSHAWGLLLHNAPFGRCGNWILDVDYSRETARDTRQLPEHGSSGDEEESHNEEEDETEQEKGVGRGERHDADAVRHGEVGTRGSRSSIGEDPLGALAKAMGVSCAARVSATVSLRSSERLSTASAVPTVPQPEDGGRDHRGGSTTIDGAAEEAEGGVVKGRAVDVMDDAFTDFPADLPADWSPSLLQRLGLCRVTRGRKEAMTGGVKREGERQREPARASDEAEEEGSEGRVGTTTAAWDEAEAGDHADGDGGTNEKANGRWSSASSAIVRLSCSPPRSSPTTTTTTTSSSSSSPSLFVLHPLLTAADWHHRLTRPGWQEGDDRERHATHEGGSGSSSTSIDEEERKGSRGGSRWFAEDGLVHPRSSGPTTEVASVANVGEDDPEVDHHHTWGDGDVEEEEEEKHIAAAARRLVDGTAEWNDAYDTYMTDGAESDSMEDDGTTEGQEKKEEEEEAEEGMPTASRRLTGSGGGSPSTEMAFESEDPTHSWCMLQDLPTSSFKGAAPRSALQQLHKAAKFSPLREGGGGRPGIGVPGDGGEGTGSSSSPSLFPVPSGEKGSGKKGKSVTFDLPSMASQLEITLPPSLTSWSSTNDGTASSVSAASWVQSLVQSSSPTTGKEGGGNASGAGSALQQSPTLRKNLTPLGKALLLDKNAASNVLTYTQTAYQRHMAETHQLLLPPPWRRAAIGTREAGALSDGSSSPASSSPCCLPSFLPLPPLSVEIFFQPFSTDHSSWNVLQKSVSFASSRGKDRRLVERGGTTLNGGRGDGHGGLPRGSESSMYFSTDATNGMNGRREDVLPVERIPGGVLPMRVADGRNSRASSVRGEEGEEEERGGDLHARTTTLSYGMEEREEEYDQELFLDDGDAGEGMYVEDDAQEENSRREAELQLLEQLQANALHTSGERGNLAGGGRFSLSSLRFSRGDEGAAEEEDGEERSGAGGSVRPSREVLPPEEWMKVLQSGPGPLGFLQTGIDVSQLRQLMWEAMQEDLSDPSLTLSGSANPSPLVPSSLSDPSALPSSPSGTTVASTSLPTVSSMTSVQLKSNAQRLFALSDGHSKNKGTSQTMIPTQDLLVTPSQRTKGAGEDDAEEKSAAGTEENRSGRRKRPRDLPEAEKEEEATDAAASTRRTSRLSTVVARLLPYVRLISPTAALSPAFLFFSLLFIANEHNVVLANEEIVQLDDVKISGIARPVSECHAEEMEEPLRKKEKKKN